MSTARLTPYRSAVLDVLRSSCDHPTAADVYRRVRRRCPRVAYATIYNALGWLTRHGMATELKFGDGANRYDPITARHDHLVCVECGSLVDFEVELPRNLWSQAGRKRGFQVRQYRLELLGVCPRCQGRNHHSR